MDKNFENPPCKDIVEAIELQNLDFVKYFIEHGVDPNLVLDEQYGIRLIHYASVFKNTEIIKYLVSKNALFLIRDNYYDALPMHFSCLFSMVDNVKYFITDLKVDPNERAIFNETALHFAVHNPDAKDVDTEKTKLEIVKFLVENTKVDINAKDDLNKTALYYAGEVEQFNEIADYLRSHMVNLIHNLESSKIQNRVKSPKFNHQINLLKQHSNVESNSRIDNQKFNSNANVQDMDFTNILMLLNVLVRKFTNQKFIADYQTVSSDEARIVALNIIHSYEKILKKISMKFDIEINFLDPTHLIPSLISCLMNGKLKEIPQLLVSAAKMNNEKLEKELLDRMKMEIENTIMKEIKPNLQRNIKATSQSKDMKSIFNKLRIQSALQYDVAKIEKLN